MPELPEVEILARHLRPLLMGETIRSVEVFRPKTLRPTSSRQFKTALKNARFIGLVRRGKYLLFEMERRKPRAKLMFLGHLGMTGRMFVTREQNQRPKHTVVVLNLGAKRLVFEDTRYFGRMTLDVSPIKKLGPEPLDGKWSLRHFQRLKGSRQAIKVRLLDQSLLAGLGNIYASEALFRAGISPKQKADRLSPDGLRRLFKAIRQTLTTAIKGGSTVPLNFGGTRTDSLFYFGRNSKVTASYKERLRVYDRAGEPCVNCGLPIRRIVQAGRSTFYCSRCQTMRG